MQCCSVLRSSASARGSRPGFEWKLKKNTCTKSNAASKELPRGTAAVGDRDGDVDVYGDGNGNGNCNSIGYMPVMLPARAMS